VLVRLFPKQPLAYLNKLTKNNKIVEKKLKSDKINELFIDFAEKSKEILPDEETDCSLLLVKDDSVRIGTYVHGRFDNLANAIIVACENNKDLRNLILDVARLLNNKDKGDGNPLEDLRALLNGEELDDNAIMRILGNGGNIVN
jgi:hypothetical protein